MRTYPRIDEAEIAERKRIRPLFEKLHELAETTRDTTLVHARKLHDFMEAQGFVYGDLVALRERPYYWDRFHAERWNWFLHQVMNRFSEILN